MKLVPTPTSTPTLSRLELLRIALDFCEAHKCEPRAVHFDGWGPWHLEVSIPEADFRRIWTGTNALYERLYYQNYDRLSKQVGPITVSCMIPGAEADPKPSAVPVTV